MITFIDSLLNRITMYRLVLYFLILLLAAAAVFGYFGILPYPPINIAFSAFVLVLVSWITNEIFARVFKTQTNVESVYITALILALIITPVAPADGAGIMFLLWAAIWAMACKYMLAIKKKHLFNPAAFAVALTAITIGQSATWWVGGNLPLLAFVLMGGLLVTKKIQRFDLVLPFFATALGAIMLTSPSFDPLATVPTVIFHTPLFFFAFIMLTEPLTTPPTRMLRIAYGALVGVLFAPALHIGSLYSTPELALLAGNVFSYIVSPKGKFVLPLARKEKVGEDLYHFSFATDEPLLFRPGQYMEWTLGHAHGDSRGNRRYFTIATSPTEGLLGLGVKFYDRGSNFKKKMLAMRLGEEIVGGQLAGDFVLPKDKTEKLAFIAGGIGITPFRSMIKYLADREEQRDVALFYSNRTADEIAYREVFDEAAQKIGLTTVYAITDPGAIVPPDMHQGRIDAALIKMTIPDYRERTFYLSGPHTMTNAFEKTLHAMGVTRNHIKTDFFPGFV